MKAGLELARKDLDRLKNLSADLVSDQQKDRQQLVVQQAEAKLAAAEALLEKAAAGRRLSVEAAEAKLQAARASKAQVLTAIPVKSLEKRRDLARKQWQQTVVKAPCKGIVLDISVRPGEMISVMPVLQMADLERMVAVAEVYETDLKRIRPGQAAVIHSKALRPPYDSQGLKGKVSHIEKIISTPELKSLDPLARADRHVAEVRVELDAESSRQAANFANLQVDVTFLIDP